MESSYRQLKLLIKDSLFVSDLLAVDLIPFTQNVKPLLLILKEQVALGRNNSDRLAILRMCKQETCPRYRCGELVFVEMAYRK